MTLPFEEQPHRIPYDDFVFSDENDATHMVRWGTRGSIPKMVAGIMHRRVNVVRACAFDRVGAPSFDGMLVVSPLRGNGSGAQHFAR